MSDTATGRIINLKDILWDKPNLTAVGILKYFEERGYVIIQPPEQEKTKCR